MFAGEHVVCSSSHTYRRIQSASLTSAHLRQQGHIVDLYRDPKMIEKGKKGVESLIVLAEEHQRGIR